MELLNNDNKNNGMITKIWGPPTWESMHSFSFGYPMEPTEEHKKNYKAYYTLIGDVLPCKYCRESYKKFITTGKTKLTDEVMKNRYTLTFWLYEVHNAVNDKLGVSYDITYEDVVKRYESFRAKCTKVKNVKGCLNPLHKDTNPYKIAESKDCLLIPVELATKFIDYAKKRQVEVDEDSFINYYKDNKQNIDKISDEKWRERNIEARKIISFIRISKFDSIEKDGKWKGYPTIPELHLIMRLTTTLPIEKLEELGTELSDKQYKKRHRKRIYILV